jgi:TonB family protein
LSRIEALVPRKQLGEEGCIVECLREGEKLRARLGVELKTMLLFSSLAHGLILGLVGLLLYHYNFSHRNSAQTRYETYLVKLVNLETPIRLRSPKTLLAPLVMKKNLKLAEPPVSLKPAIRNFPPRKIKYLPPITEEPTPAPIVNQKVAYPTRLKPIRANPPRAEIPSPPLENFSPIRKRITAAKIESLPRNTDSPITPSLAPVPILPPRVSLKLPKDLELPTREGRINIPKVLEIKPYPRQRVSQRRTRNFPFREKSVAWSREQILYPIIPPAPTGYPYPEKKAGKEAPRANGGFVSFNTQDPDLAPYITQVRNRVLSFWHYPLEAKSGLKGAVQIVFTVERDGSISRIEVLKSSGYPELDKGAVQALYRASPFYPLPQHTQLPSLTIAGTFKYNMD